MGTALAVFKTASIGHSDSPPWCGAHSAVSEPPGAHPSWPVASRPEHLLPWQAAGAVLRALPFPGERVPAAPRPHPHARQGAPLPGSCSPSPGQTRRRPRRAWAELGRRERQAHRRMAQPRHAPARVDRPAGGTPTTPPRGLLHDSWQHRDGAPGASRPARPASASSGPGADDGRLRGGHRRRANARMTSGASSPTICHLLVSG